MISEMYRCPCGDWERTPAWLFWKPPFRRALYAWWNIGGGFDGWEYSALVSSSGTEGGK
ncbi:hypothetical protein ABIF38_005216 [Bradyrhizobium japonicum]|nr:hypothetical protein [Bradyrhizobium elkanii]MCS3567812.1 hypothetical protein [Bradyrhizobium elkanii]MCS3590705.1 hypothetical protein [Bradyrhizobium elkanii]MCS3620148.1 hypothetical protein [Bradyrhizobium elkanii]GEC56825.1 hypothetical protein BEL01nite_58680 [Bradyrhizobium elkanii]